MYKKRPVGYSVPSARTLLSSFTRPIVMGSGWRWILITTGTSMWWILIGSMITLPIRVINIMKTLRARAGVGDEYRCPSLVTHTWHHTERKPDRERGKDSHNAQNKHRRTRKNAQERHYTFVIQQIKGRKHLPVNLSTKVEDVFWQIAVAAVFSLYY